MTKKFEELKEILKKEIESSFIPPEITAKLQRTKNYAELARIIYAYNDWLDDVWEATLETYFKS